MDSASDCGNIYTDNPDVQQLYMALLEGSERHLRAFVKNIEKIQGEGTYTAQYLTQEEVNLILGRRARTPLSPMKKRD
jgi:tRNA isopentenyl-2-thiomethyl-A-37 hydroxylase MiaE